MSLSTKSPIPLAIRKVDLDPPLTVGPSRRTSVPTSSETAGEDGGTYFHRRDHHL
jgi:hypothetical protein